MSRSAGTLRFKLHFQRRSVGTDGWGGPQQDGARRGSFETVFTVRAAMTPLRGTESVMAERLAGRQPWVVAVRSSSQTRQVDTSWQIVDARDESRVFAITGAADPDGRRMWIELLVTEGAPS